MTAARSSDTVTTTGQVALFIHACVIVLYIWHTTGTQKHVKVRILAAPVVTGDIDGFIRIGNTSITIGINSKNRA